jgi:hypothetical protein
MCPCSTQGSRTFLSTILNLSFTILWVWFVGKKWVVRGFREKIKDVDESHQEVPSKGFRCYSQNLSTVSLKMAPSISQLQEETVSAFL